MSTRPRFESLDIASTEPLRDLAPARASELPRQQHALMSAWGGPPQCRSCVLTSTGAILSVGISYRVPPGVTEVDIAALMCGDGTILFTSPVDAVGAQLRANGQTADLLEHATWKSTGGTLDPDNGAESGRALIVRTSAAWEWTDVVITTALDASASDDLYLFALTFSPIHISR